MNKIFIILFFISFVSYVYAVESKKTVTVGTGQKLNFCCDLNAQNNEQLILMGKAMNLGYIINGESTPVDKIEFETANPNYAISYEQNKICVTKPDVTLSDKLTFNCFKRQNRDGTKIESQKIAVTVYEPVEITGNLQDSYDVATGQPFKLACEATGSPGLKVIWVKKDSGQQAEGTNQAVLTIPVTQKSDMDQEYICEASIDVKAEDVKPVTSRKIKLNILYKPELTIKKNIVSTALGVQEIIEMTVDANPPAKIDCKSHAETQSIVKMTKSNVDKRKFTTEMIINNVTNIHLGSYTCDAFNDYGQVSKTIQLAVKPHTSVIMSQPSTEYSDYYFLKWNINSRSKLTSAQIKLTKVGSNVPIYRSIDVTGDNLTEAILENGDSTNNWKQVLTYHVKNLTANTLFQLTVTSCNIHGCIDTEQPVQFTTKPYEDGKYKVGIAQLSQNASPNKHSNSLSSLTLATFMVTVIATIVNNIVKQ